MTTNTIKKMEAIAALSQTKNTMRTNNLRIKMKRTKAFLLAFGLALLAPLAARAQFGGGSGTQIDPYIILTTDHWLELADNVNNGNQYYLEYFRLDADLDFSGISFQPIGRYGNNGNLSKKFSGHFDGNGHTISNISNVTYTASYSSGLFGYVAHGSIKNLTLGGNSIIKGSRCVGGIIGVSDRCTIRNCHVGSNVTIEKNYVSNSRYIGGIVGGVWNNGFGVHTNAIMDCTNEGTVIGRDYTGGIVGGMMNSFILPITGCTNLGIVTGNSFVGGIGGLLYDEFTLSDCHVGGNCTIGPIGADGSSQGTTYGVLPQIIYGEGVSGNILSLPVVTVHDTAYYLPEPSTINLTLAYSGTVAEGYVVPFSASSGSLVPRGPYHELALPASGEDTISALPPMRDIGYEAFVSVSTPQQLYTGNPLSPVITVTDNMSGTPVTLVEGTDYEVVPPEGDCVYPGDYTFFVVGKGQYSGYAATVFTIYHVFFQTGNGTDESPFLILTTDDMTQLANWVNDGHSTEGLHFRLEADLDYTGKTYTPIGNAIFHPFRGIFNGNGHTIRNIYVFNGYNWGLFLNLQGTVKNLRLASSEIWGYGEGVGGIAGRLDYQGSRIEGCEVAEDVSIIATNYQHSLELNVGGIAGYLARGTISDCRNLGEIQAIPLSEYHIVNVGGIAGKAENGAINNCLNLGESHYVPINDSEGHVGDIAGYKEGASFFNNYYAGQFPKGGINGSDVAGQAMRGYLVRGGVDVSVALSGTPGVVYNGAVYAGAGQSVSLYLDHEAWGCFSYSASEGSLTNNGSYYTLAMPANNLTITATNNAEVVEVYGTYYRLACDDSNTAMVIYDDSYATAEAISVEDFEYQGIQYTVIGIDNYAFDGCTQLKWFDCHSNILSVGDFAFNNCDSLEYVGLYEVHTPPTVGEGAFDGLGLDTLWLMVPFCSQYEYSQHPVWGQFGTIFPQGVCEYSFVGLGDDQLWSNPENWAEGEVPGEGAQVGIMSDCEMDMDVTVGSITIGNYYDEEYGYYERLTVKSGNTLTASNFVYTTGDARNFVIEDGAQVIHPNTGTKATLQRNISAYNTENGMNNGWHLIGYSFAGNDSIAKMENLLENDYDFYYYNEPTHYWMNQENMANNFTELEAAKGYIYANSENVTLSLRGTLNPANEIVNVPLSHTAAIPLSGLNLVGNPFACNAYLLDGSNQTMPFFRMNDAGDAIVAVQAGTAIKPGEAVFVVSPNDGQTSSAIFTTTAPASIGETQNVPSVLLPLHDLLVDQDAFLNNSIVQTVELVSGWNWFSTYIEADDLLQQLEASLGENGLYIESSELLSTEYLDGEWLGDLEEVGITNEQMYLVQTSAACTIQLQGLKANPANHVITINPEWNWVGYLCSEEMTIAEALAGFVPEDGDQIESMEGYAEYLDGEWLGLETLKPGQGFLYYSNSATTKTFTFPTTAK